MRGREALFLIAGLVGGLVLGLMVAGSGAFNLQGTAAVNTPVSPAYYSLDVVELQSWLTAAYPDEADTLLRAVTNVAGLPLADDFAAAFTEAAPDVNLVTERAFQSLTGIAPDPMLAPPPSSAVEGLIDSLADGLVQTCLGIDSNPYSVSGPAVFLALQLPDTQLSQLPEVWSTYRLDTPKEGELFWQMLACHETEGGSVERSR
jgi:hypothetical protein